MKRNWLRLMGVAIALTIAISTSGLIRTTKAECVCSCFMTDCGSHSCYAEFSGDSIANCITCVAGCCKTADKITCGGPEEN